MVRDGLTSINMITHVYWFACVSLRSCFLFEEGYQYCPGGPHSTDTVHETSQIKITISVDRYVDGPHPSILSLTRTRSAGTFTFPLAPASSSIDSSNAPATDSCSSFPARLVSQATSTPCSSCLPALCRPLPCTPRAPSANMDLSFACRAGDLSGCCCS